MSTAQPEPSTPTGEPPTVDPGPETVAEAAAPRSRRKLVSRLVQIVLGLGLTAVLIVWGIPYVGKTTWSGIFAQLGTISAWHLVVFVALLFASLWCYTFLITGSLPGISHSKALTVNLSATAVSNTLPAGGVLGIAATYMMCRSWGLPKRETSNSLVIAGVWNVLVRLALPILALGLLLTTRREALPNYVTQLSVIVVTVGVGLVGAFVAAIASERAAAVVGRSLDSTLGSIQRRRGKVSEPFAARMIEWQRHMSGVVFTKWFEMTAGLAGFFFFLYLLFSECLAAVGVDLPWQAMLVVFAFNRLLTAFPITPGSAGVTEAMTVAIASAFGGGAPQVAAGAVLFLLLSTVAQIPIGGVTWLIWYFGPRERGGKAPRKGAGDGAGGATAVA